jgi:hypothetical protein
MLNETPLLYWQNYSVPIHDPQHRPTKQSFIDQIRPTNIVIVLSGIYAAYSNFMQMELDIAWQMNKPILGILPWGNQRIPQCVQDVADDIVGWSTNSIVDAIRRLSI